MSAPKVEFDFHLENPAIAAQADPVHRVVRVGDCKHLEEEEVVEVVDKEKEVDFEGEENSRACSVAGLGLGLGWMGGLSFTFFLESEFFVF